MKNMDGVCRFSDGEYGPCEGPILQLDDNAGTTHDCERHARLVAVWVQTPHEQGPIWKFLDKLGVDGWKEFEVKMAGVRLDSYIPYVPRRGRTK